MNINGVAIAMVLAAMVVPTGSAVANEAGTSGWQVDHGTDRITESTVWYAFSTTVRPEAEASPTLRRLEGRIEFDCGVDSAWVGVALSEKAQLQGSQSMLFGGKRFAEMRARWDDTVVTMTIDYEPGSRYLRFQNHDEALERLKRAEMLLVELRWVNDEWVYFRFPLSGSRHAIEHVLRECEALPERTATRTDEERFLEFMEQFAQEAERTRIEAAKKKAEAERTRIEAAKKKAEAERTRIEAAKKKAEAERTRIEAAKKKAEAERTRIEAARRKEAERALQEQIAREDQPLAKERLALLDAGRIEYIALIKDKIERNWLRPPGTAKGLKCVVRVSQIPGGEVVQAEIRESSGNIAFDRSVEESVLRSSPLPVPKDPSLFDRNIVITFEPAGWR